MIAGHTPAIWLTFAATVVTLLVVDLALITRAQSLPVQRSAWWSLTVVTAAALFCAVVGLLEGRVDALQFATGYVVEFSLSVDNLLVFIIVLQYFAVPVASQPTVLKWGILGAIVMRAIVIGAGTLVLGEFHWVIYVFGGLLIMTAMRMLAKPGHAAANVGRNPIVRIARRVLPVSDRFAGDAFFVRVGGKLRVTPLLLVVLVIEWTDLVFATDSIPAIFAITRDPFLVYTSNIFAIVGLRSLFFVLAAMLARFVYLRFGVATVLMLVGAKMLLTRWVTVPSLVSLVVIVAVLGSAVILSAARHGRR
jgi:tellurite resistance protein TerC